MKATYVAFGHDSNLSNHLRKRSPTFGWGIFFVAEMERFELSKSF